MLFVNDQFCGRVCSGYDMHSVYFGPVSLYLVRDVFEQNFEIVEEERRTVEKSEPQGGGESSCTTKKMNKNALELYLKTKYGDKIKKPRNKAGSVLSREFREYIRENKWANLKDTRVDYWWRR